MRNEVNRDSEPYIAVNPANPNLTAATAFMPTPAMVSNGRFWSRTTAARPGRRRG
jgi:hypothetical protein